MKMPYNLLPSVIMNRFDCRSLLRSLLDISPFVVFSYLGFALYINTFGNDWSFDDYVVIVTNSDVRAFGNYLADNYPGRPLRELTYLLDYQLFGYNPVGWHVQNILWHVLNSFLVFTLGKSLVGSSRVAWLAALLFLVHPVHVEVVAQTSHRKDSIALFFILSALCCYLKSRQERRWHFGALGLLLIVIGCYAKINVIMTVALIASYEAVFFGKRVYAYPIILTGSLFFLYLGPSLIEAFLEGTRFMLLRNGYDGGYDPMLYLYLVLKSWLFLFLKIVLPVNLGANYIISVPKSFFDSWVLGGVTLLAGYVFSLFLTWRRWPHACFCLLWAGFFYLPTANLWPIMWIAADRYLYTPSVGLFILGAIVFDRIAVRDSMRYAVITLVVILCSIKVISQNAVWKNNATLSENALRVNPTSAFAIIAVANHVYQGQSDRQLALLNKAKVINPKYSFVYYYLGLNAEDGGDEKEALKNYRKFFIYYDERFEHMNKYWVGDLKKRIADKYQVHL